MTKGEVICLAGVPLKVPVCWLVLHNRRGDRFQVVGYVLGPSDRSCFHTRITSRDIFVVDDKRCINLSEV